jgi:hypothetical protein
MDKYPTTLTSDNIKTLFTIGRNANSEEEMLAEAESKGFNYMSDSVSMLLYAGYQSKTTGFEPTFKVKTFYRVGEPVINAYSGLYMSSFNFATQKRELGVSVISKDWLQNLKSVFFGLSEDKIKSKGIWSIKGVAIAKGGDDEPLIFPLDYARREKFESIDELKKILEE